MDAGYRGFAISLAIVAAMIFVVASLASGWWIPGEEGGWLFNYQTLLATSVAAFLTAWVNRTVDRRRSLHDLETEILKALEFLTGGTQARSAGIGMLEGLYTGTALAKRGLQTVNNFSKQERLRNVFLPVVRNQLLYLATSSRPDKGELHEHDNFSRLVGLWVDVLRPTDDESKPLRAGLSTSSERGIEFFPGYQPDLARLLAQVGLGEFRGHSVADWQKAIVRRRPAAGRSIEELGKEALDRVEP